ncbi:MAG: alpha/beta fold hydrolase [Bdellovibrionales bacterium]|nr:alpha/beta fold hydrolase [Bdellovibrionales bacterium]
MRVENEVGKQLSGPPSPGYQAGGLPSGSQTVLPPEILKHFPFTSKYLTIAGHRMHYVDVSSADFAGSLNESKTEIGENGYYGTGDEQPVVLLLHGNPTWSFYYRELIKELSTNFRVIAPDFIGLGLSDRAPETQLRAKDRIEHLEEFIDKLGLKKFSLVMHDWGGSIGTGVAVRNPDRIERMVYLNTTLTETEALPALIKIAATPLIGKFLTQYTKQFLRFTTGLGVFRKLAKEVRAGYFYPYKTVASRKAIWDFVDDIPFDAAHPSYKTMMHLAENIHLLANKQVQIVWGLNDPCFHREMLTKVARHFPNAELIELPEASHLVLEDAKEIAIPAISTFLQKGPGHLDDEVVDEVEQQFTAAGDPSEHYEKVLLDSFMEFAKSLRSKPAVIEPLFLGDQVRYGHTSFREMRDRIYKYERGLTELGLQPKDRVLMLVPPGADFLALAYAVMGRGGIPFFLDPGMGRDNLFKCIKEIDPQVLIGSPRAQLLRFRQRELMPNLKFHITASEWIYTGGPRLSFLKRFSPKPLLPVPSSEVVFVAYTSGATGRPKGVVYTNEMLREQLTILREQFGIEAGKRDLPLLPIFSLFHLANGVCSVFPNVDPARPLSLSPERILKVVTDLEVNYSFGSPTLWNKIADYAIRAGEDFGSLQKIFMAGAPVPAKVLSRVTGLLRRGEAYTPYGATEALPVTLMASSEAKDGQYGEPSKCGSNGLYVGRPIEGVSLIVVDRATLIDKREVRELAPYEIGEVLVSGRNISRQYYKNEEATKESKVIYKDELWHRIGDVGYLSDDGGLYYCGRVAHLVKSPSRTYYSVPTELFFNDVDKVKRSALVSLGEGEEPGIVVEPYPEYWPDSDEKRKQFLKELEQRAKDSPLTSRIKWFFFHPSFPVDGRHNAKIYRDQLSDWAQQYTVKQEAA